MRSLWSTSLIKKIGRVAVVLFRTYGAPLKSFFSVTTSCARLRRACMWLHTNAATPLIARPAPQKSLLSVTTSRAATRKALRYMTQQAITLSRPTPLTQERYRDNVRQIRLQISSKYQLFRLLTKGLYGVHVDRQYTCLPAQYVNVNMKNMHNLSATQI